MRTFSYIWIALLFTAGAKAVDLTVEGALSFEARYRLSGKMETTRTQLTLGSTLTEGAFELGGEAWAWKNFSASNFQQTEDSVELRKLKASYWGDIIGVEAGVQSIQWGETFGFRPLDLVNARNYRDYPLLDSPRNKKPALLLSGSWIQDPWRFQILANPSAETPTLPATLQGTTVLPGSSPSLLDVPEFGFRAGYQFTDANLDFMVYRHLNRIPVFIASAAGLTPQWAPVLSSGVSFSKGLETWVIRADGLVTWDHPLQGALGSTTTLYSFTAGADWSPEWWSGFSVGFQGHLDRYPSLTASDGVAASFLARKSLLDNLVELELQAYQSFTFSDRWLGLKGVYYPVDHLELRLSGEWIHGDPASLFGVFDGTSRVSGQVTYRF